MRRRAIAVVSTQGISPVMAMLMVLVIAPILLLADPVNAQETTAEETTVLVADAADRKVEAETDNVSVEVDNGKVSVSTDDGSSSDDGTGQQSSMTVQQNQADEGSGSRASTGDVNIGAAQTSSSSCKNPHEVVSLDEFDEDDTVDFRTQGNKFRVSYDVFFDSNASNRRFRIEIRRNNNNNGNLVDSEETGVNQTDATFFVTDGSGNYSIRATLSDAGPDPTFDVTVDDCRGSNNNNDGRNRNRHRHHDRDRNRHHDRDRFHQNRFFGRGAADEQYVSERIVEERVIKETIPKNKGRLAATGGVPLTTGAALLGIASVGHGVSILRFAVLRREP